MRCKPLALSFFLVTVILVVAVGCGRPVEEVSISTEPAGQNLGLGPGVSPLSSGPGDKSSPRWSPSGDRLALVVDGYVVDRTVESRELQRLTTRDFGAREIEWLPSGEELAIFGHSSSPGEKRDAYRTRSDEEFLGVDEISPGVLAMEPRAGDKGLILAIRSGSLRSRIAVTDGRGRIEETPKQSLEGRITGISASPDGDSAVLAVKLTENPVSFGLYSFTKGHFERMTRLGKGVEIVGSPQWTTQGIYYVAGKTNPESGDHPTLYHLYRLPEGSKVPSLVSSVGKGFVASSIRVSPDHEMLAIIGRRRPISQSNLYVLDLRTNNLKALTANENMEIKTGPEDLAWSPDNRSIALVARGVLLSAPRVYAVPANALLKDFYNVYEVPVSRAQEARDA